MAMQASGEPCPRCGLQSEHWANNGQGYQDGAVCFCCEGCAQQSGCKCAQHMAEVSGTSGA
jgi:hypothetical protein